MRSMISAVRACRVTAREVTAGRGSRSMDRAAMPRRASSRCSMVPAAPPPAISTGIIQAVYARRNGQMQSAERSHGIAPVPIHGCAPVLREHLVHALRGRDQFDESRRCRVVTHVVDRAAARHGCRKCHVVAAAEIRLALRLHIVNCNTHVMKTIAALADGLLVDRRLLVLWLDELDHHVSGEAHGNRHIRLGGTTAVALFRPGETVEEEEWPRLAIGLP